MPHRMPFRVKQGINNLEIKVRPELRNGIYIISLEENGFFSKRLLLVRCVFVLFNRRLSLPGELFCPIV